MVENFYGYATDVWCDDDNPVVEDTYLCLPCCDGYTCSDDYTTEGSEHFIHTCVPSTDTSKTTSTTTKATFEKFVE